jgi:DNA-binding CsgD family transcriptional regulator/PAS domain-containing protein
VLARALDAAAMVFHPTNPAAPAGRASSSLCSQGWPARRPAAGRVEGRAARHRDSFDRALDACYDTLVAPEAWPAAFEAIARSAGATTCMFRRRTDEGAVLDLPMPESLHDLMRDYVREGYVGNDYRAKVGWPLVRGETVLIDHDIVPDEVRRTLPLMADLHVRHDLPWWAGVAFVVDGHPWVLSLLRNGRQGPFDHAEARHLAHLAPHFRRVISFSEKFALGGARASLGSLERLGTPALVLDRQGAVRLMNPTAEALLGPDLALVQRRLRVVHPPSDRALQDLIAALRQTGVCRTAPAAAPVSILRRGRRPLLVEAMPIAGLVADVFQSLAAILLVTDLETRSVPQEEALRAAFGLTPAEARLACHLAAGESLEAAAEALAIAKNTARIQLRAVFAKTGTARQGELIALLARLAR